MQWMFYTLFTSDPPHPRHTATAADDRLRAQAENVLFGDIEFALSKTVDERLWTHVHYRVIDDYRKRIASVCPFSSLVGLLCSMRNNTGLQDQWRIES